MIFTERTITIRNDSSSMNAPVVLYRGDKNVEVRFTLVESPYKYSNRDSINIIESTNASYAQLVIKTPNDRDPIFGDITAVGQSNVVFIIGYDMIDEIEEVGTYSFQIRLFDADQTSMVTIPEVVGGFIIREPIAKEDTNNNITNSAIVGSAVVTNDLEIPTFVSGSYNKTAWHDGDVISKQKLNKMEDGIYETYELSKVNNSQIKERATQSELAVERARIDSFTKLTEGSTTGDAELIDGRIGVDGTTYANIGTAIRKQFSNVEDELEKVKENIKEIYTELTPRYGRNNHVFFKQGSIITGNNHEVYSYKMYTNLHEGQELYLTFSTNDRSSSLEFVLFIDNDGNRNYISGDCNSISATQYNRYKVIVPSGATTMYVNYVTTGGCIVETCETKKIIYAEADRVSKLEDAVNNRVNIYNTINDEKPLDFIDKTGGYCKIFRKIGVIGDSLTCGAQDTEGGNNAFDCWEHSWPNYLSIATGSEIVKLAKGGLMPSNWHSVFETTARNENNKCTAYIIMLGHNSSLSGTIDDVDGTNPLNSTADTMYGQYARIIGTLRDICPDAKIFCVTYPIWYIENNKKNKMIREIAEKLNCYLIDLYKYDTSKDVIQNNYDQHGFGTPQIDKAKIHYTPLAYLRWSWEIMSYIDYIIRHNISDFTNIGYINSGNTFE